MSQECPAALGKEFGFRAWDENVAVDGDFQTTKGGRANNELQRLTLAAALNHFPQRLDLLARERPLEVQVKLQAGQLEQVGEQQFRLQARRLDPLPGQKVGAALDSFEDGHFSLIRFNELSRLNQLYRSGKT